MTDTAAILRAHHPTEAGFECAWCGSLWPCAVERIRQDALDGAALRELRDALPRGWTVTVEWLPSFPSGHRLWYVRVDDVTWTDDVPLAKAAAATIAEAADKCREALEDRA